MAHTADSIQDWISSYTFVDNLTASKDIMQHIVRDLENHGYKFGPTENGGYILNITGPVVNQNFVVKSDS